MGLDTSPWQRNSYWCLASTGHARFAAFPCAANHAHGGVSVRGEPRAPRRFLDDLLQVADDAVLVHEASIVAGMRLLLEGAGLVVEPSAALGVAAVLEDPDRFTGRHVVTVICGSNVDLDAYHRWIRM